MAWLRRRSGLSLHLSNDMRVLPNFQGQSELEFCVLDPKSEMWSGETPSGKIAMKHSQLEFLVNSTVPRQLTFWRSHKVNAVVECASHERGLLRQGHS